MDGQGREIFMFVEKVVDIGTKVNSRKWKRYRQGTKIWNDESKYVDEWKEGKERKEI